ncbi:type I-E CRISPR-associated protein Cse1/CasA [Kitasatospora sp. NBC_01287]|uniref:type I-E CRISPR-associated protein Cse1/CasA n=1 Tax=Kitasatospora sp. NBC_01287 TaxID=2903573 RepID=UPI00224DEE1A|nr:type I-E CRISPR-associated protein Cse1/CasA [Kitasatospora sp. NBC_01287]MCX4744806.1 type I-E CRISPR-associated protein Cse1/CasA [Kitasatospora sp. NBC_01287]
MTGSADAAALGARLTPAARSVWAKHHQATDTWLPLWRHLADSAAVAGQLWDEWLPLSIRQLISNQLADDTADIKSCAHARTLVVWLAATHDIGKATPAFACQVESLADRMRAAGLEMPQQRQFGEDRRRAPHGLAGQLLLQEWLVEENGWSERWAAQFTVIAGGHHGVPPSHSQIHDLDLRPDLLRTHGPSETLWRETQFELLDACAADYGIRELLPALRTVKLSQPTQVSLTAVVILADWIASNPELFPYLPLPQPSRSADRIAAAWRGLNLPPRWCPVEPTEPAATLIARRFALPPGATARPVQEQAIELARTMPEPGLMVIEAPMGEGKTEAALAVAEIFAARSGAGGCFIALPTRATSNAMFSRLLQWLDHLPGDGERSVYLAHAKAALQDEYAGLMRAGNRSIEAVDADGPRGIPRSWRQNRSAEAELIAHQWLRGRKKGMLASFAVGTVDQLLFAGLKSRHLALRHLALAGKVVVIDEVHAYDAYMSSYLERVLSWLGAYRVPVVMLSATLPAATRKALLQAYTGAEAGNQAEYVGVPLPPTAAYPLLTAVAPSSRPVERQPPAASGRRTAVRLDPLSDDLGELADRLAHELREGGCALVVRNTVDRVLEATQQLRERFGAAAVTVAHARFLDLDRARKDSELLSRFGPDAHPGARPAGPHIVVASQVVEQSLDIDFDLLVTDLCPVDLLLQRLGRLHRHQRQRPAPLRTARCLLTGVDWQVGASPASLTLQGSVAPAPSTPPTPPTPVRGSVAIYRLHPLLRALAVLQPQLHADGPALQLPDDISPLVQRAYGDGPEGPPEWAAAMARAADDYRRARAEQTARAEVFRLDEVRRPGRSLVGWIEAGVGDTEDTRTGRAQVRDGEESLEVLVAQRRADGSLTTVPWLDRGMGGLELPLDAVPAPRACRALAASSLRLPYQFSKPWVVDRAIDELEQLNVAAWQVRECPQLAGELVLVLDEDCRTQLVGYELQYSVTDGLVVRSADAKKRSQVPSVPSVPSKSSTPQVLLAHAAPPTRSVPSFDLVSQPWLPVQRLDGTTAELSLGEVFTEAHALRRLVGDLPTQEFALLRLLLAILHDAVEGPVELEDWEELWHSPAPFTAVGPYLAKYQEHFDLLHPRTPFFQVAELRTEKDEVASLNRIVADVPNGDPFLTMRMPGVDRLGFAEAARWLVHAHAFDTSGIKSAAVGDPRAKSGKVYPQGLGWTGNLGGVLAEGDTLRETLLLNLVAADSPGLRFRPADDRPAWRRGPYGPAQDPGAADPAARRPSGPRDLYTWQSRRIRLHHDGQQVHGVVLSYGDPLSPRNRFALEPMTGWRRSPAQERKLGEVPVYLPREHDPARAAWRGLAALLTAEAEHLPEQRAEAATFLRPRVLDWVARLTTERVLPARKLIRARIIGAAYGTQQSVIDDVVDDGLALAVVLLHEHDHRYAAAAIDAVADADSAVRALGRLASDLAEAAGSAQDPPQNRALDLGFGLLDGPYRQWLAELGRSADPAEARQEWQRTVHRLLGSTGRELADAAPQAACEGRVVTDAKGGRSWLDDSRALLRFRGRLNRLLPAAVADERMNGDKPRNHHEQDEGSARSMPSEHNGQSGQSDQKAEE